MKKYTSIVMLFMVLSCLACKKSDSGSGSFNGFKVDGAVYQLDSIEHDFNTTRRPLMIRSKDNGGATVYINTLGDFFPDADGVYELKVKAVRQDSLDVKVCFSADGGSDDYCAVEGPTGQSLSTLTVTIRGGKWTVSLPATTIYDNAAKTLEISASE